jgi:K+-sensing histidine kinase KdpD
MSATRITKSGGGWGGTGSIVSGAFNSHLAAVAVVGIATLLCEQVHGYLSPINMVMPYLLAVVLAALFLGRNPAMLTAFLGVFAFDFFFVPPRFSLQIADKEYLVTFLTFFTVGAVISSLVAKARERLETLRIRERQTATLYHLSRNLAAASDTEAIVAAVIKNAEENLGARAAIFVAGSEADGVALAAASDGLQVGVADLEVARWSFDSRRTAGRGTNSYSTCLLTYFPLKVLADTLGVLAVALDDVRLQEKETRLLVNSFATQTAMALERVRLMEAAQEAQVLKARENLERALLNSISHDLRTPLAAITGALSAVLDGGDRLKEGPRTELLATARDESERLNRFVGNLLDMTRLEAGALRPRLELSDVQDVIGCAIAAMEKRLGSRDLTVDLPPELPLVPMDLVLMVQVLVNLLDNAVKYTPQQGPIEIAARCSEESLRLEVADRGPGLPEGDLPRIFDKFYRTPVPEGVGGTGLGLSICKGIVEAHGGSIHAENREGGGLKVVIVMPVGAAKEVSTDHGN